VLIERTTPHCARPEAIVIDHDLGHDEQRNAFELSGAPGVLASTRWMMFSVRSCSPDEMKILVR